MSTTDAAMIWCPFPGKEAAREAASALLEENLIACANIIAPVESLFRWEGEIQSSEEVCVIFKTTFSVLEQATDRLAQLHPYDTPAIMGWHVDAAPPPTLAWLADETQRGDAQ